MTDTPETLAAELVREILAADTNLNVLPIRLHDDNRESETKAITISAQPGEHETDGPCGYRVPVEIEYRAPMNDGQPQSDAAAARIRTQLENAGTLTLTTMDKLSGAWLFTENASGAAEDSGKLRKRTITLPVLVVPL